MKTSGLAKFRLPCPVCCGPIKPTGKLLAEWLGVRGQPGRLLALIFDRGPLVEHADLAKRLAPARSDPARAVTEAAHHLSHNPRVTTFVHLSSAGYRGGRTISLIPDAPWPEIALGDEPGGQTRCPCCDRVLSVPSPPEITGLGKHERVILSTLWAGGVGRGAQPGAFVPARVLIDAIFADDPNGGPTNGNQEYRQFYRAMTNLQVAIARHRLGIEAGMRPDGYRLKVQP